MTAVTDETILDALGRHARAQPEAVAVSTDRASVGFGALAADVAQLTGALIAEGFERHDRCAILLTEGTDFVRGFFAVMAAGGAPLNVNSERPADYLRKRVQAAGCRWALCPEGSELLTGDADGPVRFLGMEAMRSRDVEPVPPVSGIGPDDAAFLQATSGTSGESKTALILHRNVMASVRGTQAMFRHGVPDDQQDAIVSWVPLYHSMGLNRLMLGAMYCGIPLHLVSPGLPNLKKWMGRIEATRATITAAPDFGYRVAARMLAREEPDIGSLRFAFNAGEPIRTATIEAFESAFGVPGVIRPGYGLAEANGVTHLPYGDELRVAPDGNVSVGVPALGLELQVVDETDSPLPAGEVGEIRVRGGQVFPGYCDDEEATREKCRNGWLYSGDLGWLDADGYVFIKGRKRVLIKRGGASVSPREIEEAAEKVEGVRMAAAIGVERKSMTATEDLIVVVEVAGAPEERSANEKSLVAAVASEIQSALGFGPSQVLVVPPETIPRTANGKVRHEELKRLVVAGEFPPGG